MDALTIQRIQTAHPKIRSKLLNDYQEANKLLGKGVRLRFSYVLRTLAEQAAIYAQGRTTKGRIVSNAKPGYSIHNYGLAFDIVMLYDKNGDGVFEEVSWDMKRDGDKNGKSDWMTVANYFVSKGWEWGGNWKSFKDYPHFQLTYGNTASQLFAKQVIPGTSYVNI